MILFLDTWVTTAAASNSAVQRESSMMFKFLLNDLGGLADLIHSTMVVKNQVLVCPIQIGQSGESRRVVK